MPFAIFSRRENVGDRCPQCRQINVDFMDVGGGLLGCYQCGCVFVRKVERKRGVVKVEEVITAPEAVPVTPMEVGIPGEDQSIADVIGINKAFTENSDGSLSTEVTYRKSITGEVSQAAYETDMRAGFQGDPLTCDVCGKKVRSAFGLRSHKRSHR